VPEQFAKYGVRFPYPSNWKLEEEELDDAQTVTLSSPGTAFCCLVIHPGRMDAIDVVGAMLDGLRAEYEDVDVESVVETHQQHELVGYDVNFYCLDLTNTARLRGFATAGATYVIFCQAEDSDFDNAQPIFRAITIDVVRTAQEEEGWDAPGDWEDGDAD